jgi:hypothetical protein
MDEMLKDVNCTVKMYKRFRWCTMLFSSHNAKHNCKTIFLADWNVRERWFVVRNYQHIKVHLRWITIPSIMPHPSPQHQSSQIFTRILATFFLLVDEVNPQ